MNTEDRRSDRLPEKAAKNLTVTCMGEARNDIEFIFQICVEDFTKKRKCKRV
jgi:hypothetical protein